MLFSDVCVIYEAFRRGQNVNKFPTFEHVQIEIQIRIRMYIDAE